MSLSRVFKVVFHSVKLVNHFFLVSMFLLSVGVAVDVEFSQTNIHAGDLILVHLRKWRNEKGLKVYENGERRVIYRNKEHLDKAWYYFFTGTDIERHASRYTYRIVSDQDKKQYSFRVAPDKQKKPTGTVTMKSEAKKKILSQPRSSFANENAFFHRFFLKENKVQKWRGAFVHPVPGARISSDFGKLRIYNNGRQSYHRAVDYAAPEGVKVRVVNHGHVVWAGQKKVRGKIVVVDHGCGLYSSYWHLDQIFVKMGQSLKKGKLIGTVGQTGMATGPHVHWEVRIRNKCVDGKKLFGFF